MIMYIIALLASPIMLKEVKEHESAFIFVIVLKSISTLYFIYWDICEDWGLLWGGISVKKFKDKSERWAHGGFCKRPSNLKLFPLLCAILFDIIARGYWILIDIESLELEESFWFNCLIT